MCGVLVLDEDSTTERKRSNPEEDEEAEQPSDSSFAECSKQCEVQAEAAACWSDPAQLSSLLWLRPGCCRVEGGCCPCSGAVGLQAASAPD